MFEIPPIDGKLGWILMDPICPLQEFESGQLEKQLRRLERKIAAPRMRFVNGGWGLCQALGPGYLPSGYVKIAIENGQFNSGFSHEKW